MSKLSYRKYSTLKLASDRIIRAAMQKYGAASSKFDHRYLMYFLEDSLNIGELDNAMRWRTGSPKKSFANIDVGTDIEFSLSIANAALIWAILNRFPGYEKTRLTSSFFDKEIFEAVELYELAFGRLRSSDCARLKTFEYVMEPTTSRYKIFDNIRRSTYPIACTAWRTYNLQKEIVEDNFLPKEIADAHAYEAIKTLTGDVLDISESWDESIVSYELAAELFETLSVFYADARNNNKDVFKDIETVEDVSRLAHDLDMDLKIECFLDGVPAGDIVA